MSNTKRPQLSAEDWLFAGCRALTDTGPTALKAEPLARQLGTTKGSFYWHFADVPAFHAALLSMWETRAVSDIIALTEQQTHAKDKLRHLIDLAATGTPPEVGGAQLEPAIRAWGRGHDGAANAIERVDARRLAYLGALFDALGAPSPHAAHTLYSALVGFEMLRLSPDTVREALFDLAERLLISTHR